MNRSLALSVVAICVLIGLAFWMLRDGPATTEARNTRQEIEAPTIAPAQVELPHVEPVAPRDSERTELEVTHPSAPASLVEAKVADDGLAELRGRFVVPGAAPAVGVKLKLGGWAGNNERVMKYGEPKNWNNLEATTDTDGRFSFRFDPPRAYQFVLEAELPVYAKVSWRWSSLPPQEVTDVGEIVLARSGSIRGKIVDSKGNPVDGSWMVYADSSYQPRGAGGDQTRKYGPADPVSAEFLLEGLPPGPAQLKAHSQIANWIDGPSVVVASGEVLEANIVYSGPD